MIAVLLVQDVALALLVGEMHHLVISIAVLLNDNRTSLAPPRLVQADGHLLDPLRSKLCYLFVHQLAGALPDG